MSDREDIWENGQIVGYRTKTHTNTREIECDICCLFHREVEPCDIAVGRLFDEGVSIRKERDELKAQLAEAEEARKVAERILWQAIVGKPCEYSQVVQERGVKYLTDRGLLDKEQEQ